MSPETVIHVGRQAVETVLLAASPMLIAAMVIGLLISGVAIAVFVTTKKTSQVGDALGRYQESFRYASSVMSRDI